MTSTTIEKDEQPRHGLIRRLWRLHFSFGLTVLCIGMICNGGRKYVPADPQKDRSELSCNKLYVNVYSSSLDDEGAVICCTDHLEQWTHLFSYEGFLCNTSRAPFSRSLTRFPDSWLLPLIPIMLRVCIELIGINIRRSKDILVASIKRMLFYICIFQLRGWGLYVCFNMVEGIIVKSDYWPKTLGFVGQSMDQDQCWYSSFLQSRWRNDPCHGLTFDFSDHVVLFFAHHFPTSIFEALFCVLFPFWPMRNREYTSLHFILNTLMPFTLLGGFVYLNIITFLAIHSTAAYFHSSGEVLVGYIISLIIQLPVGFLLWADSWKSARKIVGFSIDRDHLD